MDRVAEQVQALTRAMKESEDYRRYERLERELGSVPELKTKIDEYRLAVYHLQQSGSDIYDESDSMAKAYDILQTDPLAVAYLDAESSVCRMIQRVIDKISADVTVDVPE
ncbi:MAG: YlbF family regulator [Eubacterium sp.]|nr:YlbF family regulator [Eubacterium sp.]